MRVLLDSFFDAPQGLRANRATEDYLNALAAAEGLDLARQPTTAPAAACT